MDLFADIRSRRWLYVKGTLFVCLALVAAGLMLLRSPDWQLAVLLAICVWASCRAYYFAFYVIEHYVDPSYRFAGLTSFVRYLISRQPSVDQAPEVDRNE